MSKLERILFWKDMEVHTIYHVPSRNYEWKQKYFREMLEKKMNVCQKYGKQIASNKNF